jgi:hypothetical protein
MSSQLFTNAPGDVVEKALSAMAEKNNSALQDHGKMPLNLLASATRSMASI